MAGRRGAAGFLPPEGRSVGRRGIKEFRAAEALQLIAADRDHQTLVCPTCGSSTIERTPKREDQPAGRITLKCGGCGRSAVYLAKGMGTTSSPEAPRAE